LNSFIYFLNIKISFPLTFQLLPTSRILLRPALQDYGGQVAQKAVPTAGRKHRVFTEILIKKLKLEFSIEINCPDQKLTKIVNGDLPREVSWVIICNIRWLS